jgi:hypothetical protein
MKERRRLEALAPSSVPEFRPLTWRAYLGRAYRRGRFMTLWLLSFTQREVAVIVEAETLAHARLLAAANQVCRASLFDEGVAIKPSFQARIPAEPSGERFRKMRPRTCSVC